jgi:hypothetical protein
VTGIEAKHYPTEIYLTFTPAQKAKHWQLMHPGKTPGTGPAKSARGGAGATASGMTSQIAEFKSAMSTAATAILDFMAATQKRPADDKESDPTRGFNRDNPALGRQDSTKETKELTPRPEQYLCFSDCPISD